MARNETKRKSKPQAPKKKRTAKSAKSKRGGSKPIPKKTRGERVKAGSGRRGEPGADGLVYVRSFRAVPELVEAVRELSHRDGVTQPEMLRRLLSTHPRVKRATATA